MKNSTISLILVVLVIMQFDDFVNPSPLDYVKFVLIGIALVLNLIAWKRGIK